MRRLGWLTSWRLLVLAVALVAAWVVWLTVSLGDREQQAEVESQRAESAERSLDQLAEDVARVCSEGGPPAERLGTVCLSADELAARLPSPERGKPGEPGEQGEQGAPGRGITSTRIDGGRLVVTYTDGTARTVGPVTGDTGPTGPPGRSITATTLDGTDLVVTYSDGAREQVGRVVGRDGDDGRSVETITAEDGRLTVTYSDGTTDDAGPLPPGPQGERGPEGERGPQGAPPQRWTWTDPDDGTTYTCSRDDDSPATAPTYTCRAEQTDETGVLEPPG